MNWIKKILLWFIGLILLIMGVIFMFFNFKKDYINSKIVNEINAKLKGELTINAIELSLFSGFPEATIALDSVVLYEHKLGTTEQSQEAILRINRLNVVLDVKKLIEGKYLINEFKMKGGVLQLVTYADSTLNLLNAIATSESYTSQSPNSISLKLELLEIDGLQIKYDQRITQQHISSKIIKARTSLEMRGDSLYANLDLSVQLDSFAVNNKSIATSHTFSLSTKFESDLEKLAFKIDSGSLKIDLIEANLSGTYNYADSGFVDIHILANHEDLSELAKLEFLNPHYLPDIRKGELSIDAQIRGNTIGAIPVIDANAHLRNLQVYNAFGKVIDKAGLNLKLYSGKDKKMQAANLLIDSLQVSFTSGGFVKGRVEIMDFQTPSFIVNWEATEQLDDLYKIFSVPQVKSIRGVVSTTASLQGKINLKSQKLLSHSGAVMVKFDSCNIVLANSDYMLNGLNGTIYMVNGDVGVDGFSVNANMNDILLNGRISNLLPYLLNKPAQFVASLSIKSNYIDTNKLLAFDKSLVGDTAIIIRDLDVSIMAELSSKALKSYRFFPTGEVDIQHFTASVSGVPSVANFKGKISVDENLVAIKNMKGIIGKSAVDFSVSVSNFADYLQSDSLKQMVADIAIKSERINVKDFFTIGNKFVLPKNYEKEVLKNVSINTKLIATNFELQKKDLLPEFEFQFSGLQFQTLYSPVVFKDIFIFGLIQNNSVYLNSMFGKFGRSDVFMNAEFDNVLATKDTISRPFVSRVSFNAGVLDLNELVKLDEASTVVGTTETTPSNPFAENFPITDFNVHIGKLVYYDATINNLSGTIKIEENNKIKMEQVKLESGEYGHFEFNGSMDASSHSEAILSSTINISNVDLSKLNVKYVQNGEEVRIRDHFSGHINGKIVAEVPIMPDFSFDLARLIGKIKVKMTDGALINYAPLKELGRYFKNKDLNNIRFDELKNTMVFNQGKMLLPFMTINTTLGTINLMGFQSMDYDMNYDVQVPIKLVAGAALNSLFASKKGDDGKKDIVKKSYKGKYITIHISGGIDNYNVKLGKKHVLSAPPGF